MFAFKGQGAVFYSAAAEDRGAHSRRQDPKTPVEQALMRGHELEGWQRGNRLGLHIL